MKTFWLYRSRKRIRESLYGNVEDRVNDIKCKHLTTLSASMYNWITSMNSSKDCLNASNSALYSRSTPEPVPASYVQIQNELTPARSPGSCKVRFSEKANKICNPTETNLDETNSDIQSGKTYIGFNSKSSNGLLSGNSSWFYD